MIFGGHWCLNLIVILVDVFGKRQSKPTVMVGVRNCLVVDFIITGNMGAEPEAYGVKRGQVSPFRRTGWFPKDYFQLLNAAHREKLKTDGYFVLEDFFSTNTIRDAWSIYNDFEHAGVNQIGMYMSAYSNDVHYRKQVHNRLWKLLEPELHKVFCEFKPLIFNFVVKHPRPKHSLPLHQDPAFIDEREYSSINIWACMMDVVDNGAVCVIPKTQYVFPPCRTGLTEEAINECSEFLKRYAIPISMKAGDLLVFDSRLIHYSLPNMTDKERVAVVSYIYPEAAPLKMTVPAFDGDENECNVLELELEDLFQSDNFESADRNGLKGRVIDRIQVERVKVSEEQWENYFSSMAVKRTDTASQPESNFQSSTVKGTRFSWNRLIAFLHLLTDWI